MPQNLITKTDILRTIELLQLVAVNAEVYAALDAERLIKVFQTMVPNV
jgi:hypothetical protein